MTKLLKKDLILFRCLRENARATLTQISKQTNIPISTLYDRLRTHEKNNMIKHTSLLDFARLGYQARVQFLIKTKLDGRERLAKHLMMHEHINSLYRVNCEYDFLVEGIFRTVQDVADFSLTLEQQFPVEKIMTNYIVEELRQEGFIPANHDNSSQLLHPA